MSWANRVVLFSNLLLLGVLIWGFLSKGLGAPPAGWTYQDLVTILLTAVAVILAGVTVFIAILAIWGYNALKDAAEKEARAVATDVAQSVAAREAREAIRFANMAGEGPSAPEGVLDKLRTALKLGGEPRKK